MKQTWIDILFDAVAWLPVETPEHSGEIPHTTHEGVLKIGDSSLKVYTLSDGQRIVDADDMHELFDPKGTE